MSRPYRKAPWPLRLLNALLGKLLFAIRTARARAAYEARVRELEARPPEERWVEDRTHVNCRCSLLIRDEAAIIPEKDWPSSENQR